MRAGGCYNRYSGVLVFVTVHDNPQYGCELYTVTGHCQAISRYPFSAAARSKTDKE